MKIEKNWSEILKDFTWKNICHDERRLLLKRILVYFLSFLKSCKGLNLIFLETLRGSWFFPVLVLLSKISPSSSEWRDISDFLSKDHLRWFNILNTYMLHILWTVEADLKTQNSLEKFDEFTVFKRFPDKTGSCGLKILRLPKPFGYFTSNEESTITVHQLPVSTGKESSYRKFV